MATKTESDTKKTTAKKTTGSGTKTTAAKSTAAKTTTAKTTAAKTAASKPRTTGAAKKKQSKLSRIISIAVLVIVIAYAGIYLYQHRAELKDDPGKFLAQTYEKVTGESLETSETTTTTSSTTTKTESTKTETKPAAPAVKPKPKADGAPEYSFEGDLGYAENNPLFFGNPTDAIGELSSDKNYLMVKKQYPLSYNTSTLNPNWVAWHLDKNDMGDADRSDDFRPDPDLPADWYAVRKADYQYNDYGYDRGHVCPSADRTATLEDNSMTFLMTNMMPQTPDNNRVIWMHFENFERELVKAGNEVYIIAGPYGVGGTSQKGYFEAIEFQNKKKETMKIQVPSHTWKVLIAIPDGTGDLDRINENATVIAINVPNNQGIAKNGDWEQYLCSIDEIEALTGYDFFELLPDSVEDVLEAKVYERVK